MVTIDTSDSDDRRVGWAAVGEARPVIRATTNRVARTHRDAPEKTIDTGVKHRANRWRLERSAPGRVQRTADVPRTSTTATVGRADRAEFLLEKLRERIDRPTTELEYETPYQLLVAVILSAQCTDDRVNEATPVLFEAYPTVEDLAEATPDDIYPFIQSITFPNNKSGYLAKMARQVVEKFDGRIPDTIDGLETLMGVGRKTARVVAQVAHDADALPVDTHVFRVANRIGLVTKGATTPKKVEQQLKRVIPKEDWGEAHHLLILHGRYTCTARSPDCHDCPLPEVCTHYDRLQNRPDPIDGLDASAGTYYCTTSEHYFDDPDTHVDRYDLEQVACPHCGSMQVVRTSTGQPTKQVKDYRVNG
ncbi:MAG: endonuclease III [Bacteroidetes bacterium SW_8_64_56]|jgi:endonuclease-3|nr:MAG: endonuclease III [Bacteroidetes bacterium SW_8_64_56]